MTRLFSARISPFMRSRKARNSASAADSAATGSAWPGGSGGGATSAAWERWRSISERPGAEGHEGVLERLALRELLGAREQALVGRDGEQQGVRVVLGAGEAGGVVGDVGEREVVVGEAG